MQTRIIKTKFWEDDAVLGLSAEARSFYLYLLTNSRINFTGVYELPDSIKAFQTGFSLEKIQQLKDELRGAARAGFLRSWVIIPNACKNNNYLNTPSNYNAYKKELETIPEDVMNFIKSSFPLFENYLTTTVYTTVYSSVTSRLKYKIEKKGGTGGNNSSQNLLYYELSDYLDGTPEQRDKILNCCEYGAPTARPDWKPPRNTPEKYVKLFLERQNANNH